MSSLFRPLPRSARRAQNAAYLEYLQRRNGTPDIERRTLSHRERFFSDLEAQPVRYDQPVPRDEYLRILETGDPRRASPLSLWMAVMAMSNEAEAFVVKRELRQRRFKHSSLSDHKTFINLEELYHTRILGEALSTLDVPLRMKEPHRVLKYWLMFVADMPKPFSYLAVFLGEIIGVLLFMELRDKAVELFGADTPVGRRITALLDEILIDEVGHMVYARSQLGMVRLSIVHLLFKLFGEAFLSTNPAFTALLDIPRMAQRARNMSWQQIPSAIRERAFLPQSP